MSLVINRLGFALVGLVVAIDVVAIVVKQERRKRLKRTAMAKMIFAVLSWRLGLLNFLPTENNFLVNYFLVIFSKLFFFYSKLFSHNLFFSTLFSHNLPLPVIF